MKWFRLIPILLVLIGLVYGGSSPTPETIVKVKRGSGAIVTMPYRFLMAGSASCSLTVAATGDTVYVVPLATGSGTVTDQILEDSLDLYLDSLTSNAKYITHTHADSSLFKLSDFDNATIDTTAAGLLEVKSQGIGSAHIATACKLKNPIYRGDTTVADSLIVLTTAALAKFADDTAKFKDSIAAWDNGYFATQANLEDSLDNYYDANTVKAAIEDSLDGYSLTGHVHTGYMGNTGDTVTGHYKFDSAMIGGQEIKHDTSIASEGEVEDSLDKYWDTTATRAQINAKTFSGGTVNFYGDANFYGTLNEMNYRHNIDITNAYAIADTGWLRLEINRTTAVNSPATCSSSVDNWEDSGIVLHPAVVYVPNKWNGYRYWMAYTPYGACMGAANENMHIMASNDGRNWYHDIFADTVDLDTIASIPAPHSEQDGFVAAISNPVFTSTKTCDPDLILGHDGYMYVVFKEERPVAGCGDATPCSSAVYVCRSSNGYTWDSTTILKRANVPNTGLGMQLLQSPAVIYHNNKYKMFFVDSLGGTRTISMWVADSMKDTWTLAKGVCSGFNPVTASKATVFHMDIIPVGGDCLIGLGYARNAADTIGGTTDTSGLFVCKSMDGGYTWTPGPMILKKGASSFVPYSIQLGVDSTGTYRASGFWVEDGLNGHIEMFYTGTNKMPAATINDIRWRIFRGNIYFDNLGAKSQYANMPTVYGRDSAAVAAAADSCILTFPLWQGAGGTTGPMLFMDSCVRPTTTASYDTVCVSGVIPYDAYLDSIILCYKAAGDSGFITGYNLMGPDRSNANNMMDSAWGTSTTDLKDSVGFTRKALATPQVSDGLRRTQVNNGDRFLLKIKTEFHGTTMAKKVVKVAYVTMALRARSR